MKFWLIISVLLLALIPNVSAPPVITFVGSVKINETIGCVNPTALPSITVQANDLVVAHLSFNLDPVTSNPSVTDNQGNSYTLRIRTNATPSGSTMDSFLYTATASASGSLTVTIQNSGGSTRCGVQASVYRGVVAIGSSSGISNSGSGSGTSASIAFDIPKLNVWIVGGGTWFVNGGCTNVATITPGVGQTEESRSTCTTQHTSDFQDDPNLAVGSNAFSTTWSPVNPDPNNIWVWQGLIISPVALITVGSTMISGAVVGAIAIVLIMLVVGYKMAQDMLDGRLRPEEIRDRGRVLVVVAVTILIVTLIAASGALN